ASRRGLVRRARRFARSIRSARPRRRRDACADRPRSHPCRPKSRAQYANRRQFRSAVGADNPRGFPWKSKKKGEFMKFNALPTLTFAAAGIAVLAAAPEAKAREDCLETGSGYTFCSGLEYVVGS